MRHYTTNALPDEVRRIAPEAMSIERDRGMTTFTLREHDIDVVVSELRRADYRVEAGWPRVSYSSPYAFGSAASRMRH